MKFRRLAIALALLVLVVAGSAVGWEWRHPTAFPDYDGGTTSGLGRSTPDGSYYFGMTWGGNDRPVATARSARAVVSENSANAEIDVLVCEVEPPPKGSFLGVASDHDIETFCRFARVSGAHLNLPGARPRTQLIVRITPRQVGRVIVEGIDLNYDQGWRTGKQHVGQRVIFRIGQGR